MRVIPIKVIYTWIPRIKRETSTIEDTKINSNSGFTLAETLMSILIFSIFLLTLEKFQSFIFNTLSKDEQQNKKQMVFNQNQQMLLYLNECNNQE